MMSSTTATARSSAPSSPSKKKYNGGHTNDALSPGNGAPAKGYAVQQINKKVPKAKSGKPHQPYHKRQNNDHPKHNMLLHRLSLPSSPSSPPGTLLERIGGSVEDEAVLPALTDVDGGRVSSEGADSVTDVPFSTVPHYYTPEPGEVERFLESVIGAPPPPPSPSSTPGPVHVCLGNKPTLALETNLPVDRCITVDDSSSSVLYSPTQTAVNSLPSAHLTLDCCQDSPLGDTLMPPPSASTLEECRKNLIPVLLASAQARDPGKRLDSEQCHELLSDDHCKHLFWKAKEMRGQLASRVSQKTLVDQGWSGSLKRDHVDDVDAWVRNTRNRFNSMNTVVSDVSRRDSDITLVDFGGGRLPPKAPRAMLQASQAAFIKSLDDRLGEAPCEGLVASPTAEDHPASATSLIELFQQAIKMFPALMPTSQSVTDKDASSVPVGMSTCAGDPSGHPSQVNVSPSSTDFVSHLPTQPGIWFKQQGRQHAEIVDVDIDVSDEMFILSRERLPFRLRMHLRLCSVPVDAVTQDNSGDTSASLQHVDSVIEHHALHWPQKGKLVVQVNPESERSQTWLPYTLESDPLDVTSCVRPGKNTFRFIQLSDLSEFTFVLAASAPPPEDAWRSWDWASLARSTTDDSMNDLSEFARVPVTVRS